MEHTKKIIDVNGFGDKITAIRGRVEKLTLPVEKVLYYIGSAKLYLITHMLQFKKMNHVLLVFY